MEKVQVLIVDDHPVVRQGLKSMLANSEEIEVVGEAGDGPSAIQQAMALQPDVVLMDIRMPGPDGIQLTRRLRAVCPETKVLILTIYDEDDYLLRALRAGAWGYLLKNISAQELVEALLTVHRGQRLLSPSLLHRVLERFQLMAMEKARLESGLSEQELEVLRLIAEGATNKEIAEKLYWSEITVKRKTQDIYCKLNVTNRTQAVAEAIRRGLI